MRSGLSKSRRRWSRGSSKRGVARAGGTNER
jgi:hypothetical protein